MGNKLFGPAPSSPELTEPWRKINCKKDEMLHEVENFKPSTEVLRILLYGPTGAGKSSFINSVQRILLGRNAMSALENSSLAGASFTKKMTIHKMKKGRNERYPLDIVDIMGIEIEAGIKPNDIIMALKGHISDDYTFNPSSEINEEHPKYKKNPTLRDKIHCLVCILSADSVSRMDNFEKIRTTREGASLLGIPQVIIMTQVDKACELVKKDQNKTYYSKKIQEKAVLCSCNVGVPLNAIYPVKNYSESNTQDPVIDMFILHALKDILHFANDFVERELEKEDSK